MQFFALFKHFSNGKPPKNAIQNFGIHPAYIRDSYLRFNDAKKEGKTYDYLRSSKHFKAHRKHTRGSKKGV
jgi:hypothetical protein